MFREYSATSVTGCLVFHQTIVCQDLCRAGLSVYCLKLSNGLHEQLDVALSYFNVNPEKAWLGQCLILRQLAAWSCELLYALSLGSRGWRTHPVQRSRAGLSSRFSLQESIALSGGLQATQLDDLDGVVLHPWNCSACFSILMQLGMSKHLVKGLFRWMRMMSVLTT